MEFRCSREITNDGLSKIFYAAGMSDKRIRHKSGTRKAAEAVIAVIAGSGRRSVALNRCTAEARESLGSKAPQNGLTGRRDGHKFEGNSCSRVIPWGVHALEARGKRIVTAAPDSDRSNCLQ